MPWCRAWSHKPGAEAGGSSRTAEALCCSRQRHTAMRPHSVRPTAARRQPLLLFLTQQHLPVPPLIAVQHRLIHIINNKLLWSMGVHTQLLVGLSVRARLCRGALARATGWALPLCARWDDLWCC